MFWLFFLLASIRASWLLLPTPPRVVIVEPVAVVDEEAVARSDYIEGRIDVDEFEARISEILATRPWRP